MYLEKFKVDFFFKHKKISNFIDNQPKIQAAASGASRRPITLYRLLSASF